MTTDWHATSAASSMAQRANARDACNEGGGGGRWQGEIILGAKAPDCPTGSPASGAGRSVVGKRERRKR